MADRKISELTAADTLTGAETIPGTQSGVTVKIVVSDLTALAVAESVSGIHAATDKATPVDADEMGVVDSAASWALKKLTWANLKTTLSGVFAVLAGKSGGQTLIGGTGVTDKLVLQGTSGNGTTTATALQVNVGNNGSLAAFTIANNGQLTLKGSATTDLPTYSAEFLLDTDWTSTGWTGDFAAGWIHTAGNTTVLSQSKVAVNATKYQIAYTVTSRTAGSFTIGFGGQSIAALTATGAWGPTTTSTANLTITPTTDFDGKIVISIKSLTAVSTPLVSLMDSSGAARSELRSANALYNTFIGVSAGRYNTTGTYNTSNGYEALSQNTTGFQNTASGMQALTSNTTGLYNTADGFRSLFANTTGINNTAMGFCALFSNTSGYSNTAVGYQALNANTSGFNNTSIGYLSGNNLTTGSHNLLLGYNVNAPSATANDQLVIGNLIFGTGVTGIGATIAGLCGIGTNAPSARLHSMSTTEQLRLGYDVSNYLSATVSSAGNVTLDTTGGTIFTPDTLENTVNGAGIILRSPDGTRYRLTVANGGTLAVSAA